MDGGGEDMKIKTKEIELLVASYFKWRPNLIIPNVSWGMFHYECDLIVLTQSGYMYEVEIKVSLSDLKKDMEKKHGHFNEKIKYLYFAIPEYLEKHKEYIPDRAGIIVVRRINNGGSNNGDLYLDFIKYPEQNSKYKVTDYERYQLARLGALRIWGLKAKLLEQEQVK